jgi:hypothetical protein
MAARSHHGVEHVADAGTERAITARRFSVKIQGGGGGSNLSTRLPRDEENPPHPDYRTYAQRHDHWPAFGKRGSAVVQVPIPTRKQIAEWKAFREALGLPTDNLCWCGLLWGHDWPGQAEGKPHPPQ